MKTPRRWFPTQFSLRTLLLLTFLFACGASPAARWIEVRRATHRFEEAIKKERVSQPTALDVVIAGRAKFQAVCVAPFADLEQAKRDYDMTIFFAVMALKNGPSDFRSPEAESVRKLMIAEYYEWFDQGFPDHRRDAELQALLVEAIPQARASRQEWMSQRKIALTLMTGDGD